MTKQEFKEILDMDLARIGKKPTLMGKHPTPICRYEI